MRFLVVALIAAIPSFACTMFCTNTEVGPSFRVKVENRGNPVKGLRLTLTGERSMSAETDENGFASFARVPAGNYSLAVARDAGWSLNCILVKLDHSSNETVSFLWPTHTPIPVRSLRGAISSSSFRKPDGDRSLDLLEAISGRKLKTIHTDKAGEFDFEYSAPGLYFIGIKHPNEPSTELVAVTVTPQAPADHLELDITWVRTATRHHPNRTHRLSDPAKAAPQRVHRLQHSFPIACSARPRRAASTLVSMPVPANPKFYLASFSITSPDRTMPAFKTRFTLWSRNPCALPTEDGIGQEAAY